MLTMMKKTRKMTRTGLGLELSRFFLEGVFRPAMDIPREKGMTYGMGSGTCATPIYQV